MIMQCAGLAYAIYIISWTPAFWGIRWPLVGLLFCGIATGSGLTVFLIGAAGGIVQTASRIKKKIERNKTIKTVEKLRAIK